MCDFITYGFLLFPLNCLILYDYTRFTSLKTQANAKVPYLHTAVCAIQNTLPPTNLLLGIEITVRKPTCNNCYKNRF